MTADLRQRAIVGTLWYGGSRLIIQALTWVITIVVARILDPADYGLFGFALLVMGLVDLINELGLGAGIIQRKTTSGEMLETVFWLALSTSLAVYGIGWVASPWIAEFFKQPQLVAVLRVSMLGFVISTLRVISWNLITKDVDFKNRSLAEVAANVLSSASTLGMALAGFGVWALVAGAIGRQVVLTVSCLILRPWWPRGRFNLTSVTEVFRFGLSVSAARVAWYAYSNADFFIIGKLLGQQLLGLYTMVYQLATLPADRITTVVNQVAYPVYAELQDSPERLRRYFLKLVTLVSLVTFPVLIGLFMIANTAIPLVLTDKWTPIIVPLKIMCWVGSLISIETLIAPVVLARGRPDLPLKYNLLSLVVMPAGFLVGVRFGLEGVAWAWLLIHPPLIAFWFWLTRGVITYEWRELASALRPAFQCTSIMLVGLYLAELALIHVSTAPLRLLLFILIGILIYGGVFIGRFRTELVEIRQLFARRLGAAT